MMTPRSWLLCVCGVVGLGFAAFAVVRATQQQAASPQALHDATASVRDARYDADNDLERHIRMEGMEPGRAGVHLIRPVEDPLWSSAYSRFQPHADYRWFGIPARYADVEYQRLVAIGIAAPRLPATNVHTSQRRLFANSLGTAASTVSSDGSSQVTFAFSAQGIAALQALLEPKANFADLGEYSDWFRITRLLGQPETPMKVAVVSDHRIYKPLCVQEILASAGPNGASVIVADRLSSAEAQQLAARLNQR